MTLDHIKQTRTVQWLARFMDGNLIRRDGTPGQFENLNLEALVIFELWHGDRFVVSTIPPPGVSGRNLIWRERITQPLAGGSIVGLTYLVGWYPMGPYWAYDASDGQLYTADQLAFGTLKGMFDPIGEVNG